LRDQTDGRADVDIYLPSPGIAVAANTPLAIQVDVNPNVILSATLGVDFSLSGAVSAQQFHAETKR